MAQELVRPPIRSRERSEGFTLLEVLVYAAVLVIVIAPITSVFLVSTRAGAENDAVTRTAERNRITIHRIADDVRPALRDTVAVSGGGKRLELTLPDGFDGEAIVPGTEVRFDFELVPGEQQNGADDNGNGLADEGRLVRRDLRSGESVAISESIDLQQSGFELAAGELIVTLTHVARVPQREAPVTVSRTVSIVSRN